MIQDLNTHKYHNEYSNRRPIEGDIIFAFSGREILVNSKEERIFPVYEDFKDKKITFIYLFAIDEQCYYLAYGKENMGIEGYGFENINLMRTLKPRHLAFAAMTAFHLFNWYHTNQFCGCCKGNMVHSEKERALYCEACGNMVFPRISPAVIVGVTDGSRILMTKYAGRDYKKYALVAGFCEIGETAEKTVEREVLEEVGLKVKNIRYYKSQPWGFAGDLLLGFFAEVEGNTEIKLDETELSEGVWIEREDIELKEDGASLTEEMILHFKNHSVV